MKIIIPIKHLNNNIIVVNIEIISTTCKWKHHLKYISLNTVAGSGGRRWTTHRRSYPGEASMTLVMRPPRTTKVGRGETHRAGSVWDHRQRHLVGVKRHHWAKTSAWGVHICGDDEDDDSDDEDGTPGDIAVISEATTRAVEGGAPDISAGRALYEQSPTPRRPGWRNVTVRMIINSGDDDIKINTSRMKTVNTR